MIEETNEPRENQGTTAYDVIVLGAGPVGQNVADHARAGGLSVGVVERELAGGACPYWACAPSKALLRPVIADWGVGALSRCGGGGCACGGRSGALRARDGNL